MALTGRILANVYGKGGVSLEKTGSTQNGRINYFPNQGTQFYAPGSVTTLGSVTIGSIIEVYATGLNQASTLYQCVETPAQLVTNGS